ncbi:MAG: DNA polymerase/3'-5' exonuclease PolX [bacterium]
MPVHNSDVVRIFEDVADLLEIQGENEFRVRAYREAARTIESLSRSLREMLEEQEDLSELDGIGDDLAEKIEEIVETGELSMLLDLKQELPEGLIDMLHVEGLGPTRVQQLYDDLGISSLDELEQAGKNGKIETLDGFGEKTQQNILEHLEKYHGEEQRFLWSVADEVVPPLIEYLQTCDGVGEVVVAGSYRRRKETVGDLDVLVTSDSGEEVSKWFVDYEDVDEIVSRGETKSTIILHNELQVDLRVIPEESYGAAMHYFTGSKPHNIALRNIAVDEGWKLNEYGLFDEDDEKLAGETEAGIYDCFDLPYIEPELREDHGEIEAAREGDLPELVELEDLQGDLQSHTTDSDGKHSLKEMVEVAREVGHDYYAVTDHSKHVGITQGLDEDGLRDQNRRIDELNDQYDEFQILKGIEVDILEDGTLALKDEILDQQDLVLCAVHTKFDLPEKQQTERICRALEHPAVNIYVHPTCRKINEREPIDLEMETVMDTALENDSYLEINAQPVRLDLNDRYARRAKEKGLKLSISTDAHNTGHLFALRHGIGQARRGWLEKKDVLNTRTWAELKAFLD